jgi:hypothetical protein
MKFILVWDTELKKQLLNTGYQLISDSITCSTFVNDSELSFNFSNAEKSKFAFSNKLMF